MAGKVVFLFFFDREISINKKKQLRNESRKFLTFSRSMLRVIFLKFCREVFLGCSRLNEIINEKLVLAIVISCARQYLLPKVFFNDHEVIFTLFDLIGIYIRLRCW